ncbi:MAG TPA: cytidylate kinase-like family protein [Anaerolineaceae bacterium]
MTVVTISRQLGSLGFEVANAAAERLQFRLVQRELINEAARRAGVPDLALATIDELGLLGLKPTIQEQRAYHRALVQVMDELANEGRYVIVGRAGQAILHGRAGALHVRVIAPMSLRIERIMQRQAISAEAAKAQIEASDHSRRVFLRRFYASDWDSAELYDLVINTEKIDPHTAAELICDVLSRQGGNNTSEKKHVCID